ncbi:hypothetical protein ACFL2V_19245 [Pseudomonadota bacterium]
MVKKKQQLCMLVGLSLISAGAYAQTTVAVSGTVSEVYDPNGVVADINLGDIIGGQYTYEDTTFDQDSNPNMGYFMHNPGTGGMDLTLGAYQFTTDSAAATPLEVMIDNEAWGDFENYHAVSFSIIPTNGATINYANINLSASGANALGDDQLHDTPPDMALFNDDRSMTISGMKNGYHFSISTVLQSFDASGQSEPPAGTSSTYKVTAQVNTLDDYSGDLAGRVAMGDVITLYYTLDPNTPDSDSNPMHGHYLHAPSTGSMTFELADGTTITSDATQATPELHVFDETSYDDFIGIHSMTLVSDDPALTVQGGDMTFFGPSNVINDDSMNLNSMLSPQWTNKRVGLHGNNWWFEADVLSIEQLPTQTVEVVPGDATIHFAQRFDMAIHLNNYAAVDIVGGSLNGMPIDNYLQGCMIDPPMGDTQSLLCSDTHELLMPGQNTLELNIMLNDQSIVDTTVEWNRN